MKNKTVIIGSNSFSGSHFVNHLLESGMEVIGISRSPELHPVFLPYESTSAASFHFHQLDLNRDLEQIVQVIKECRPDYIINFAAQGMVAESWGNPAEWLMTNTVSAIKLHDQLRHFDFIKKFVQISTPEVYGSCEGNVQENTIYTPSTPYAVSKAAVDMNLMCFYNAYNFPVTFTRASNVYGPGQQLYRIIPRAILFFCLGKKLQLHGGGTSIRSFIHIRDVADGTFRVMTDGAPGQIYHFSTTRMVSIRKLVEMIAEQMGVSFDHHVEITGDRLGKDNAYRLDSSKAREELQWQDNITLEQGIEDTIGWIKNNLPDLQKQSFNYTHKP